jgi:hypothetical protein
MKVSIMTKKAQGMGLGVIITVILLFLVAGLAAIYSLDVLEDTQSDFCDYDYDEGRCFVCGNANYTKFNATDNLCYNATATGGVGSTPTYNEPDSFNATQDVTDGVAKVPEKMPTLGNVVIAAIIIGVLLAAFGGFMAYKRMG